MRPSGHCFVLKTLLNTNDDVPPTNICDVKMKLVNVIFFAILSTTNIANKKQTKNKD